jgi:hypothetical protein
MIAFRRSLFALVLAALAASCTDATGPATYEGPALLLSVVGPQTVSAEETAALAAAFDRVDEYQILIVDAATEAVLANDTIDIVVGSEVHALNVEVSEDAIGSTVTITLIALSQGMELYRSVTTTTLDPGALGDVSVELEVRYTGPGIRGTISDEAGLPAVGVNVNLNQGLSTISSVPTEEDGSYLFVGFTPGLFQVEPTPSTGFVCPTYRDIDASASDALVVANFQTSAGPCNPVLDVLVLSGGDFDDTGLVQTMLSNNQNFDVSTFFFLNQLPGIDLLSQFDVVLVFANGLFDESIGVGTEIADYIALGGNVVIGSFYWQGRTDGGLGGVGWGALENSDPYLSTGGATYTLGSLGTVDPHPLTTGLTALTSTGYWGGVAEKPSGTTVVASWADGTPLVGYRLLPGGQRVVGVSLFPASTALEATGDVQILWDNAVNWAGQAGGPSLN